MKTAAVIEAITSTTGNRRLQSGWYKKNDATIICIETPSCCTQVRLANTCRPLHAPGLLPLLCCKTKSLRLAIIRHTDRQMYSQPADRLKEQPETSFPVPLQIAVPGSILNRFRISHKAWKDYGQSTDLGPCYIRDMRMANRK